MFMDSFFVHCFQKMFITFKICSSNANFVHNFFQKISLTQILFFKLKKCSSNAKFVHRCSKYVHKIKKNYSFGIMNILCKYVNIFLSLETFSQVCKQFYKYINVFSYWGTFSKYAPRRWIPSILGQYFCFWNWAEIRPVNAKW